MGQHQGGGRWGGSGGEVVFGQLDMWFIASGLWGEGVPGVVIDTVCIVLGCLCCHILWRDIWNLLVWW